MKEDLRRILQLDCHSELPTKPQEIAKLVFVYCGWGVGVWLGVWGRIRVQRGVGLECGVGWDGIKCMRWDTTWGGIRVRGEVGWG